MSHMRCAIRRSVANRCLITVFATVAAMLWADRPAHGQCEAAQLTAPGGEGGNDFARGVAIDGDVAVVGDPVIEAVYVFRRGGGRPGDWVLEQVLTAPDAEVADQFGQVAIDGDVILVGAPGAAVPEFSRGAGYVYRYNLPAGQWRFEQQLIASDGEAGDKFGWSVAIDGDVALLGARDDDPNGESQAGSAYVFRYDPSTKQWIEEAYLTDPKGAFLDLFGQSVSLRGDVALIGAHGNDDAGLGTGAAFVFRHHRGDWLLQTELTPFDGGPDVRFGWSVSLANDVALIGALNADGQLGAAYVFRYDGKDWKHEAKLTASDPVGPFPLFGTSVSISPDGTSALIGAMKDYAMGFSSGAAHLFVYNPKKTPRRRETAKLMASDGAPSDIFGRSVAAGEDVGLVGAPRQSENPGTAYVFDLDPPLGDLDCDGQVGAADLLALLSTWGPCDDCRECPADLNDDCTVGASDLRLLLVNWG